MIKFTGLEGTQKKSKQLEQFASDIDGLLGSVAFDPNDPEAIERAVQEISDAIDERAKGFEGNDWVQKVADGLKEQARKAILDKAAAERSRGK
ncbi:hypothetical protein [Salipiger thiooxidans]|uniref:hypothetical protein n=1 Tax=Salipiger thiooxidans TaxID=282683 RepID=UPI001CD3BA2F|nr:hypothetical protein [Salipiger thiooxidans]MCA0849658.1 hypothetical protein [Salipiger thiooxidans]